MNYFDCHCDTLTEIEEGQETLYDNSGNIDLCRAKEQFLRYGQIFALWRDRGKIAAGREVNEFLKLYHRAMRLLAAQADKIQFCTEFRDMERAFELGKCAAFLSVEDISIMGVLSDCAWDMGIRFVNLTWNYENEYGYGAAADNTGHLKEKGRLLVMELQEKGIVLDVSHLSEAGFFDICELTVKPFFASHSNSKSVLCHPRNLSDHQIKEIIHRNGICGINLYAPFVAKEAGLHDLMKHIEHVLSLGGADALSMGCDFDGSNNQFPKGICGIESIRGLADYLLKHNFNETVVNKILYQNAYEFLKRTLIPDKAECGYVFEYLAEKYHGNNHNVPL